jgi:hypothetical protein
VQRAAKYAEKVVAEASRNNLNLALVADAIARKVCYHEQMRPQKILFVECHREYVDDYIAELKSALSDLNIEIHGLLTADVGEALQENHHSPKDKPLADYVMTTLYHFDLVKRKFAKTKIRPIVLSHTLDQDAIKQIVSLPNECRVGVLLGPVDPPPAIIQSLEFYRDVTPGSVPFAVITDRQATKSVIAKSDVIVYTAACIEFMQTHHVSAKHGTILIRFVPDQGAIDKVRMLLNREKSRPSSPLSSSKVLS